MHQNDVPSLPKLIARERDALSRGHRQVADYVLAHPFHAATMGIEELAAAAEVSVATINRFARRLGLAGFAQFRAEYLKLYRRTLAPIEKLKDLEGQPDNAHETISRSLDAAAKNIGQARNLLNLADCERAIDMILNAKRIMVVGVGISAALARFTIDVIGGYCASTEILDGTGGAGRMNRRVMQIGEGDLVIGISLPRYTRFTIDVLRQARDQGAQTLAFTDVPSAPAVPFSHLSLFSYAEHEVLHGSYTSTVALIEGVAAVLTRRCQTVDKARALTERLLPHLFIDMPRD